MSISASADGGSVILDFYSELGLDRDLSVEELRDRIEQLRLEWRRRAAIVGKRGDQGRQMLQLLDRASEIFADEDSRERYDRELRVRGSVEDEAVINWVNRAWSYYFREDYGPASVAARKARQHNSEDPMAYVVSAWIELAEGEHRKAEEYASEAYVLDELNEDTFDVHRVRGATFHCSGKYQRAAEAFRRALARAPEEMKADTYWRLALVLYDLKEYSEAFRCCLLALEFEECFHDDNLEEKILKNVDNNIRAACLRGQDFSQQKAVLGEIRKAVEGSAVFAGVKCRILDKVDRWMVLVDKEIERLGLKELEGRDLDGDNRLVDPAPPKKPELPGLFFVFISLGLSMVLFVKVFVDHPNIVTALLFLAPAGWAGISLVRRSWIEKEYRDMVQAYKDKLEADKNKREADRRLRKTRLQERLIEIDREVREIRQGLDWGGI